MDKYDLIIIGGEPAKAAYFGKRVALIDAVYNFPKLADSYRYAAYNGLAAHEKWLASNCSQ